MFSTFRFFIVSRETFMFCVYLRSKAPNMKKVSVGELILLIFAGTVAFVLCTSILGMAFTKTPVTEFTAAIRTKLVDLIQMIAGAVIGVVSTLLASNKKDKEP